MKNLSVLILLFLLLSCNGNKKDPVQPEGASRFRTTAPSHLYFKNIRSIHYEMTTEPDTRIDLYKFRRFSETDRRPILYPVIVDNWMQDEAYLLIRPNDYRGGIPDMLQVEWQNTRDSGRYLLQSADWTDQHRFAQQLYQSLQEKHQLLLLDKEGNFVPLFDDKQDQISFLTTMRDYYRLTER